MPEILIGKVTDYFARPVVAAVKLVAGIKVGETLHIKGHTTDLTQVVNSMQINNVSITEAKAGDEIGIKVNEPVRKGDDVYLVKD
jgi:hypothetical protein